MSEVEPGNWRRPVAGEGSGLNVVAGRPLRRVSDRVIVLPRLVNASGGKDPDFWYAFEGAEDW
jgi:hypothetical protein